MDYTSTEQKRTLSKRLKIQTKELLESLFGPIILLVCFIFRIKTGYRKGEKLILMSDHGKFKKGTNVDFVKLYHKDDPFSGPSLIAVNHEQVMIVLPEYLLKEKSYLKRFLTGYEFNAKMIKGNWRLAKSHPFLIMKIIYGSFIIPFEAIEFVINKVKEKFNG